MPGSKRLYENRKFLRLASLILVLHAFGIDQDSALAAPQILFSEIDNSEVASVNAKLRHGADPNETDRNGASLLWRASAKGKVRMVRLLLYYGADPDLPDSTGKTPLYWAASNGYVEVVKLLIAHGADPNHPDGEGSAIEWAIANKHQDVVEVLKHWTNIRRHYLLSQLPRFLDRIPISQRKRLEKGALISGKLPYTLPTGILCAPWRSRSSFVRNALEQDRRSRANLFGKSKREPLWRKRAIVEIGQNIAGYNPLP